MNDRQAEKIVKAVAVKLKERREALGLSMNQVAKLSNLDQRAVSRIEKGEFSPTLRAVLKICAALKVKLRSLLPDE